MLPILKRAPARCTLGASQLMPLWLMPGIILCGCRVTLTISHLLGCGATWGHFLKSAHTCVCCRTQCCAQDFGARVLNGGITRSPTGKNMCQHSVPAPQNLAR